MEIEDVGMILMSILLWFGGILLGLSFGGLITTQQCAHETQQIQMLQAHGIMVTVTDSGKIWGWDEKHRVSYQIKDDNLDSMVRGLR
jgi:hypothetical protein